MVGNRVEQSLSRVLINPDVWQSQQRIKLLPGLQSQNKSNCCENYQNVTRGISYPAIEAVNSVGQFVLVGRCPHNAVVQGALRVWGEMIVQLGQPGQPLQSGLL